MHRNNCRIQSPEEQIYNWCKSIIEDAPYTYGEPTEQSKCENEPR